MLPNVLHLKDGKSLLQNLKNKMSWFKKFISFITPLSYVNVRTRDGKGRYIADDPTTIENEAYTQVRKKRTKK